MLDFLFLILSLVLLYFGAEIALNSSEKIGLKLKWSPLMIGMLLVGLGTSLPEFFVSHIAAFRGEPDIALGNVIGSNITNIFLVLGLSAYLIPISLKNDELIRQFKFHLILTIVCFVFLLRLKFDFLIVITLFIFFIVYLILSKKNMVEEVSDSDIPQDHIAKVFIMAVIGFTLLYYGGELLVDSGKKICQSLGISEYVISAILIAFGTSFPELVTSLLAVKKKKHTNLIVGNVIGSNIFNIAFVLGTLFPYSFNLKNILWMESVSLILVSLILYILAKKDRVLGRPAGVVFLLTYISAIIHWLK